MFVVFAMEMEFRIHFVIVTLIHGDVITYVLIAQNM